MVRFSAAFAAFLFFIVSVSDTFAQNKSEETMADVLQERLKRLESVCGEWTGVIGEVSADATLYMEDTSSAIGELHKDGNIFFIHCFAEDMAKSDEYEVGVPGGYDYCIHQQSEGEVISVIYLTLDKDVLKGICVRGSENVPVAFSRKGQSVPVMDVLDGETLLRFEDDKWSSVTYLNTVEAYESYLADFPQGRYAADARRNIASIKEAELRKMDLEIWETALKENTPEAYEQYLKTVAQYKEYEDAARGRLEILTAEAAEKTGDYDSVLAALERAEGYMALPDDMISMRERNKELKAYDHYLKAGNDLQAISRGMDFVNTFLRSEKRNEVSDRVAYLMASTPSYLAGTPVEVMLTYAKTDETKEFVVKACKKAQKMRYRQSSNGSNLGFNFGIGAAVSNPLEALAPVYGGHFLFSIGDNRNFLNFEFGARYGYWSFVNKEDASDKYDFHQLRLVAAPKFNLIRQKKSSFYMYVAPEAAYGYPIDPHATRTYEPNSLSFGGRVGVGFGHFDLSASYMVDYWPMVKDTFTATYYPTMIGVALTVYLSGSGR